jgi:hypothetical protein
MTTTLRIKKDIDAEAANLPWNAARILYLEWWLENPKMAKCHAALRAELAVYQNAGDKPWPVIAAELTAMRKAHKS